MAGQGSGFAQPESVYHGVRSLPRWGLKERAGCSAYMYPHVCQDMFANVGLSSPEITHHWLPCRRSKLLTGSWHLRIENKGQASAS